MNARHIRLFKRLRPGSAFAVASRDPDRARAFGGDRAPRIASAATRRRWPPATTALVIGDAAARHTPTSIEAALAAGKHLLIEKPVLARFDELERLWPVLKRSGRTVMVAENLHYAPFHRRLKALLARPALGRPLILDLIRLGRSKPTGWRADPAEMPLGALHEGGVHWIRRLLDLAAVFEPDGGRSNPRRLRHRARASGHRHPGRGHDDDRGAPPLRG